MNSGTKHIAAKAGIRLLSWVAIYLGAICGLLLHEHRRINDVNVVWGFYTFPGGLSLSVLLTLPLERFFFPITSENEEFIIFMGIGYGIYLLHLCLTLFANRVVLAGLMLILLAALLAIDQDWWIEIFDDWTDPRPSVG